MTVKPVLQFFQFLLRFLEIGSHLVIVDSSSVDASQHDRYLIYDLLNRTVAFCHGGESVEGRVSHVLRDIFENVIVVEMDGRRFRFREPAVIVRNNGSILFVYGDMRPELTDEELFTEARGEDGSHFGESVHDVLCRTPSRRVKAVQFNLGPKTA